MQLARRVISIERSLKRGRTCSTCHGEGKVEVINEMLDPEPRDPSEAEGCPECGKANFIVIAYEHRPIDR